MGSALFVIRLPFVVLVKVDGHGLGRYAAVESHFKIEEARAGIAGGCAFRISGDATEIDNLLAVEPCLDPAGGMRPKTNLKAEVEPMAAKIAFHLVQDEVFVVDILSNAQNPSAYV